MTLMEKLRQLLGNKLDETVDENIKLDDIISTEMASGDTSDKNEESKTSESENIEVKEETNVENTDSPASGEISDSKESNSGLAEDKIETTDKIVDTKNIKDEVEDKIEDILEEGWFDIETGKLDSSKIHDDKIREAFELVYKKFKMDDEARIVASALDTTLSEKYNIVVKPETIKSMLDLSSVKVNADGSVTGLEESINKLKESEPGLFKNKEQLDNPINEGFNPVTKRTMAEPKGFSQAFRIMEEIS